MLVFDERSFLLWKDQTVFFPAEEFLRHCVGALAPNHVLRISQTSVDLPDSPKMVRRKLSRSGCLDLSKSPQALFEGIDDTSHRWLRKAERLKSSIEVKRNDKSAVEDFRVLYNEFVTLKGHARLMSVRYLRNYLQHADVFVAYCDDRPICGHLMLRDKQVGRVRLGLSANRRLESRFDAELTAALNRNLHWHEIQTYKFEGFSIYDFAGVEDEGIRRFKMSFGAFELVESCYVFMGRLGVTAYEIYARLSAMMGNRIVPRKPLV